MVWQNLQLAILSSDERPYTLYPFTPPRSPNRLMLVRSRFYYQVNLDLTISILSFLLSENGLFLREPLINELLDTMDEVSSLTKQQMECLERTKAELEMDVGGGMGTAIPEGTAWRLSAGRRLSVCNKKSPDISQIWSASLLSSASMARP